VKKGDAGGLVFEAGALLARVEKLGDLFEPVLTLRQRLPEAAAMERSLGGPLG